MKISTWNVNGLRAVLQKGFLDWTKSSKPDVICLQEIKAKPDQVDEEVQNLDGYQSFWNPAERAGYSGVLTYSKNEPIETKFGLGIPRFDEEGRLIRTEFPGFYLYNIYFPNGKRDQTRLDYKLDFYAQLLDECDQLHKDGKRIVITGDFNTAHNEIDLTNPKANSKVSGFLSEERAWIDRYIEHGFVDAFRVLYPERVQYTWWTYRFGARKRNIGWRLDYYLVSESMMDYVNDVVVQDQVLGSDHCPVTLDLKEIP